MAKKKKASKKSTVSFESSLAELESVVGDLEQGKLSLDDSLKKYEAGVKHLRECYRALQEAESKIRLLVDVDESGNARLTKAFPDQDSSDDYEPESNEPESHSESDEADYDDFSDEDPNDGTLF